MWPLARVRAVEFQNQPSLIGGTLGCWACDEMGALLAGVFCGVLRGGVQRQSGGQEPKRERGESGKTLTEQSTRQVACSESARPWFRDGVVVKTG